MTVVGKIKFTHYMTEFTLPLFEEEIKGVYEQVLKRVNLVKSTHSAKQSCIEILKYF